MRPAVLLPLLLAACSGLPRLPARCEAERLAEDLTPAGATDCGHAAIDGPVGDVLACEVDAFEAGTPFVSAIDWAGIDSGGTLVKVWDGTTLFLVHDESGMSMGSTTTTCDLPLVGVAHVASPYDDPAREDVDLEGVVCGTDDVEGLDSCP